MGRVRETEDVSWVTGYAGALPSAKTTARGDESPTAQSRSDCSPRSRGAECDKWLWLDSSVPCKSKMAELIMCNLHSQLDDEEATSASGVTHGGEIERQESVGFARIVSKALGPREDSILLWVCSLRSATADVLGKLGEGSLLASVFTLVSSAMGAGCLSLPFMLKRAGVVLGVLMLLVGALLAHLSLVVLMSCARYTKSDSMAKLVALAQGGGGRGRVVDIVIAIYGIAAVLCYLIFIGDFFSGIAQAPFVGLEVPRETVIVTLAASVVLPLSLPRNLSALCYVCVLSVAAICLTAVVVALKTPHYIVTNEGDDGWELKWWSSDPRDALHAFSIALFAFAAHTNAVPVATALKKADGGTIWRVSLYSVCIELVFYSLMGLGGYLSFRSKTKQDFILNYRNDDIVMFLVRCIYGVVVCLGAPINLSPAASSIVGLISQRGHRTSRALHCCVVTMIITACVVVAVYNEHIADVIGLIGSSFGSLIVLAWPAMIYRQALFDMHPHRLAKFVYYSIACAAVMGFAAFSVQAYQAYGDFVNHLPSS